MFILLFCFSQNTAYAAIKTYSLSSNQIKPNNLAKTLKSGGFILDLKKDEIFSYNNFEILATSNSFVYINAYNKNLTTGLLDGSIENNVNQVARIGEIFIHDRNKTIIENFDVEHFLKLNASSLPLNLVKKLETTSKKQNRKKSLGFYKDTKSKTSELALNNLITSLQNQDISNVIINEQTMDLSQFQTFVIEQNLPLHILISWGTNVFDLDIHLTGPQGSDRFHVFYLNKGDLQNNPNAAIIDDCISTTCSEVVRINDLNKGGIYRASIFNHGDQTINGNGLSSSDVEIEVIRGGTYIRSEGDTDMGSLVSGGNSIFKGNPTAGQTGNTWQAIEINPDNGKIDFVDKFTNFNSAQEVE